MEYRFQLEASQVASCQIRSLVSVPYIRPFKAQHRDKRHGAGREQLVQALYRERVRPLCRGRDNASGQAVSGPRTQIRAVRGIREDMEQTGAPGLPERGVLQRRGPEGIIHGNEPVRPSGLDHIPGHPDKLLAPVHTRNRPDAFQAGRRRNILHTAAQFQAEHRRMVQDHGQPYRILRSKHALPSARHMGDIFQQRERPFLRP